MDTPQERRQKLLKEKDDIEEQIHKKEEEIDEIMEKLLDQCRLRNILRREMINIEDELIHESIFNSYEDMSGLIKIENLNDS